MSSGPPSLLHKRYGPVHCFEVGATRGSTDILMGWVGGTTATNLGLGAQQQRQTR